MIGAKFIDEIIALYRTHGWVLRRVLLTRGLRQSLGPSIPTLFENLEPEDSDTDAAWFSRDARGGAETWEIRHLSEVPFALLQVIDKNSSDDEREALLDETLLKLREKVRSRGN